MQAWDFRSSAVSIFCDRQLYSDAIDVLAPTRAGVVGHYVRRTNLAYFCFSLKSARTSTAISRKAPGRTLRTEVRRDSWRGGTVLVSYSEIVLSASHRLSSTFPSLMRRSSSSCDASIRGAIKLSDKCAGTLPSSPTSFPTSPCHHRQPLDCIRILYCPSPNPCTSAPIASFLITGAPGTNVSTSSAFGRRSAFELLNEHMPRCSFPRTTSPVARSTICRLDFGGWWAVA